MRSLELQPKFSLEHFFSKKLSWEVGACYFWTGPRMHYVNFYEEGMGVAFLGIGPAKGNDLFSDFKYFYPTGFYLGFGYFYRHSYFTNKHSTADVGDHEYQYYNQSESSFSNFGRFTFGKHYKLNKNLYINPYASIMIGSTSLQLKIDTTGGKPENYSRDVTPIDKYQKLTRCILVIGCNFSFDIFQRARKPD